MSTARRVIERNGADTTALARELRALPLGRYVLVPEGELADNDGTLSADEEDGLLEALAELERGEGLPGEQVMAELRERAARPR